MKYVLLFAATAIIAGALSGCDNTTTSTPTPASTGTSTKTTPDSTVTPKAIPAPDNTANNKRDAKGETKTPMDQSNAKTDIDITAGIRKSIMADKDMSTNAQNVKIITEKGVVTLRGVVNSQTEKDAIAAYATATTGVTRVDNQLEVKKPS